MEPIAKARERLKAIRDDVNSRRISVYWDKEAAASNFQRRRENDISMAKETFGFSTDTKSKWRAERMLFQLFIA
tara:strand:+ start:313 stop:534 length:222 start_codon:yes stop_codon:yes gene_type:complete